MRLIALICRAHPFEEDVTLNFTATCIYPDHFKQRSATATLRGYRDFLVRIQNPPAELPEGVASLVAILVTLTRPDIGLPAKTNVPSAGDEAEAN